MLGVVGWRIPGGPWPRAEGGYQPLFAGQAVVLLLVPV